MIANQIAAMLALQGRMNSKVNPAWQSAGYAWLRAVVIEGGEAMEHYGWKWWKKQTPDLEQFKIELVDIWHFALSHTLCTTPDAAGAIMAEINSPQRHITLDNKIWDLDDEEQPMLSKIDLLIGMAAVGRFSVSVFQSIMDECGMTWDDLYTGYVAKNVLNFFRQDHGYKSGEYIKDWHGQEDNAHLSRIVGLLDSASPTFDSELYNMLGLEYSKVLLAHGRAADAELVMFRPV